MNVVNQPRTELWAEVDLNDATGPVESQAIENMRQNIIKQRGCFM